jgi:Uncharacterized conserved protein
MVSKKKASVVGDTDKKPPLKNKEYEKELRRLDVELVKLQQWVVSKGLKVCIVFEGRDGAGKGGTIKAITERVSPRVFRVVALPAPTDKEKSQLYFQRYVPHLPSAGEIVIFDRSWYNRAGVERVMGFCTEEQVEKFLDGAPVMEKSMVDAGIILLKYWLEVTPKEQERRLRDRINDGRKNLETFANGREILQAVGRVHGGARRDVCRNGYGLGAMVCRPFGRQEKGAVKYYFSPADADPVQRNPCRSGGTAET